jgi:hypothetical protein
VRLSRGHERAAEHVSAPVPAMTPLALGALAGLLAVVMVVMLRRRAHA